MMIAMMIMLLCVRFSVLIITTNAAFFHSHDHMKASHELDYEPVSSSTMFSRKLLLKEMVKEYGDQDLVLYNDQKAALLGGTQNRGNEVVIFGEKGSDPTHFNNMDYSSVRRRRPIHNNSSSKTNDSP